MIRVSVEQTGNIDEMIDKLSRMKNVSFEDIAEVARKRIAYEIDTQRKRDVKMEINFRAEVETFLFM